MVDFDEHYPNLTWPQFAICNDDATGAFEDMSRRLFSREFLGTGTVPHSDHNNPGVEVLPILEQPREDGSKQRKISFQAKYFEGKIGYSKIKASMNQAIKHYGDELDLIYLFCNKTISTTAQGYKDIVTLLKNSGIEIYPVSDGEVLDLVARYKDIANYFFLPRRRPGDEQRSQIHAGIIVNNATNGCCSTCSRKITEQIVDSRLLQGYIQEKIQTCKTLILEMEFDKLREEIDKIFSYKLIGIEGVETLLFYKLILEVHEGMDVDLSTDGLTETYKRELSWIQEYYKKPVSLGVYTFACHCVESQTIVLDKMFGSQMWKEVIELCKEIINEVSSDIIDLVKQYYGLALFNLQQYDASLEILKDLYQKCHKENILLYSIFAEIKIINRAWREGHYEHRERLIELIEQLDSLKNNKQYTSNKNLVAMLYLESAYNLGIKEKIYLENAIQKYNEFEDDVKDEHVVKYLYALCLELNGSITEAEQIYAGLSWEKDANIACRYIICKLTQAEYSEVVKLYNEIDHSVMNAKLKSLYLTALFYEDREHYREKLKEVLQEVSEDPNGVLDIAYGIHEKAYIRDDVIPLIKKYIDTELDKMLFQQKAEMLVILSHADELELIVMVLKKIQNIETLNRYVVKEIYDSVFAISNREFINNDKALIKSDKLEAAEIIADIFLEVNVSRKEFLQIKYLCAGAQEKRFSMLRYAKELFEITNEEGLARNIIAMLFERNEMDFDAYSPYIDVLRSSIKPDYCMAVAFALSRLGKIEEADVYAYKALYYLNDFENYEIYKNYFGYYNQNLNRYHDEGELKRVRNNCVVTLEENISAGGQNPKIIKVCLDSESEFSDPENKSMKVRHIPAGTPLYLKIQGSSLNQILKIEDISYRITQIQSRSDFAAGFIFQKIVDHPEKFEESVFVFSVEKTDDLIEKLISMTDRTEQIENLLNFYHFKENDIGLPIDSFTNGDYDRYIEALTMLLHTKDQAFYTGFSTYENEENQRYVPGLSTLVLLSSMNILNVLESIKSNIIIPASYIDFFAERYSKAKESSFVSPGKLVSIDNQLTLVDDNILNIEIWERILDFCTECEKATITDDDRIGFKIDNINGEQFIAAMHLNMIHLDSFVLAKKEQATLLCDDLFFRKFATYGKIRNLNFVSLLRHYADDDFVIPIILELSKTNYLYVPLMARTDEEAIQLKKNILDGKLKKKYYSDMLITYVEICKNYICEVFGEDIEFEEND